MIVTFEMREERKMLATHNKLQPGMKGLKEGHDLHMLEVSELLA